MLDHVAGWDGAAEPDWVLGSRPTRRRKQSSSSDPSKILAALQKNMYGKLAMEAYKVPSILTPCRCAVAVHPEGGMVTR